MCFFLVENNSIKQLIEEHYQTLSKKQQLVASFVLQNLTFVATHAAHEVGQRTNTSETTVIRFCYELGLEGFAHLQKEITMYLFNQSSSSALGNYISKQTNKTAKSTLEVAVQKDIDQLERMVSSIDEAMFQYATEKLHEAESIYIVGVDASQYAANWLYFVLHLLRPNVTFIRTETHELIRTIEKIDKKAVVIVISLHRYAKETLQIAQYLNDKKVELIGITDTNIAPIHTYISCSFVLEQLEHSTIDLMPSLISFINALVTGMTSKDPEYYEVGSINFDTIEQQFILDKWSGNNHG